LFVSVAARVNVLHVLCTAAQRCGCMHAPRHNTADGTQL